MPFLRRHTRLILIMIVVLAVAAVALWPAAMEVDVARVVRGPMQVTIDEDGETRVRDRFVVSAPVGGRLQRIDLEPGDRVVRGETRLARLTPAAPPLLDPRSRSELEAAVEAARAAVGQARAERDRAASALARAQSVLGRQRDLAEAGAISPDQLEVAETAVADAQEARRAAEFTVARAEHELQLAQVRLQEPGGGGRPVDIVSPIDGIVLRRHRQSEGVVPAGEPLLEIGDPQRLEIVVDLLSSDAVRVSAGDPVLIDRWGGEHPLQGSIRRVEPAGFLRVSALGVEERRVNVVIDFSDAAAAARLLGDGYRVEARVIVWEADDVVKVPIGSLFRHEDAWAVFVVEDERAHLRPVQLGRRTAAEGQIVEGLTAGETVVLFPPDTLTDGTRVAVRGAG